MKIFRVFLVLFFCLLLFVIFIWKRNIFSKEVLKLEIIGPSEAIAGQEVEYLVKYKNNGNFRLEDPQLIFELPENSLFEGKFLERKILKEELGRAIYPGEERSFPFRLRILGREGEIKIAKASLEFRPKNLKTKYLSETSFAIKIKSVPLTFEFDFPTQIFPQKDFSFRIFYFSNLDLVLKNLRIETEWPSGFEFEKSSPETIEDKIWEIPLLNKFEGGRLEISGKILGNVGEVKIFKAKLGIFDGGKFIVLKEIEKGIQLAKPLIFLRQEINKNPEYVASPGEWLHYEIYFKNIGEEELKNLFLICKLEGEAFDFETLKSETGNYQSGDNSIIFDWRQNPKLQNLLPMEEGKIEFWIKLKEDLGEIKNPFVKNKVLISQLSEEFVTKISSKFSFAQAGYFNDEIFGNSGPLPPRVGTQTTFTLIWKLEGISSKFVDLKVKAFLPENVSLTQKIFPESEISKFSFDQETREIVWKIDELEPGQIKSLAFQVSLLPKEKDKGKIVNLIEKAEASGKDTWSQKEFKIKAPDLTTLLKDDPMITEEKAIVQ